MSITNTLLRSTTLLTTQITVSKNKALRIHWQIQSQTDTSVSRYCSHCNQVTTFSDSGFRRQNANGKNIFHFAIYKCPKNHTWNNKLEVFSAKSHLINEPIQLPNGSHEVEAHLPDMATEFGFSSDLMLNITHVKNQNFDQILLKVTVLGGKHRLDKLLSERIEDVSRSQLSKWIENGKITLDGETAKPKTTLSLEHWIQISL